MLAEQHDAAGSAHDIIENLHVSDRKKKLVATVRVCKTQSWPCELNSFAEIHTAQNTTRIDSLSSFNALLSLL